MRRGPVPILPNTDTLTPEDIEAMFRGLGLPMPVTRPIKAGRPIAGVKRRGSKTPVASNVTMDEQWAASLAVSGGPGTDGTYTPTGEEEALPREANPELFDLLARQFSPFQNPQDLGASYANETAFIPAATKALQGAAQQPPSFEANSGDPDEEWAASLPAEMAQTEADPDEEWAASLSEMPGEEAAFAEPSEIEMLLPEPAPVNDYGQGGPELAPGVELAQGVQFRTPEVAAAAGNAGETLPGLDYAWKVLSWLNYPNSKKNIFLNTITKNSTAYTEAGMDAAPALGKAFQDAFANVYKARGSFEDVPLQGFLDFFVPGINKAFSKGNTFGLPGFIPTPGTIGQMTRPIKVVVNGKEQTYFAGQNDLQKFAGFTGYGLASSLAETMKAAGMRKASSQIYDAIGRMDEKQLEALRNSWVPADKIGDFVTDLATDPLNLVNKISGAAKTGILKAFPWLEDTSKVVDKTTDLARKAEELHLNAPGKIVNKPVLGALAWATNKSALAIQKRLRTMQRAGSEGYEARKLLNEAEVRIGKEVNDVGQTIQGIRKRQEHWSKIDPEFGKDFDKWVFLYADAGFNKENPYTYVPGVDGLEYFKTAQLKGPQEASKQKLFDAIDRDITEKIGNAVEARVSELVEAGVDPVEALAQAEPLRLEMQQQLGNFAHEVKQLGERVRQKEDVFGKTMRTYGVLHPEAYNDLRGNHIRYFYNTGRYDNEGVLDGLAQLGSGDTKTFDKSIIAHRKRTKEGRPDELIYSSIFSHGKGGVMQARGTGILSLQDQLRKRFAVRNPSQRHYVDFEVAPKDAGQYIKGKRVIPAIDEEFPHEIDEFLAVGEPFTYRKGQKLPDISPEEYERGTVQRIDELDTHADFSKPHGIYTSPSNVKSPHDDLGTRKLWKLNPNSKTLNIPEYPASEITLRKGGYGAGAGVHAAKHFLGDAQFNALKSGTKDAAVAFAKGKYGVDFSAYYDKQEVIEAIGAQEARAAGYDAFRVDSPSDPNFSEVVLLTPNSGSAIPDYKTAMAERANQTKGLNAPGIVSEIQLDPERKQWNAFHFFEPETIEDADGAIKVASKQSPDRQYFVERLEGGDDPLVRVTHQASGESKELKLSELGIEAQGKVTRRLEGIARHPAIGPGSLPGGSDPLDTATEYARSLTTRLRGENQLLEEAKDRILAGPDWLHDPTPKSERVAEVNRQIAANKAMLEEYQDFAKFKETTPESKLEYLNKRTAQVNAKLLKVQEQLDAYSQIPKLEPGQKGAVTRLGKSQAALQQEVETLNARLAAHEQLLGEADTAGKALSDALQASKDGRASLINKADMTLMEGPKWGTLNGHYLPNHIAEMLKNRYDRQFSSNEWLTAGRNIVSGIKFLKTVANPATWMNNMIGNVVLADAGANINGFKMLPSYYAAADQEFLAGSGHWMNEMNSVSTALHNYSEGLEAIGGSLTGTGLLTDLPAQGVVGKTVAGIQAGAEKLGGAYQKTEQFSKLALYIGFRKNGFEPYEAARLAQKYLFDYSDVPQIVDIARRYGIVPFATFPFKATGVLAEALAKDPALINRWNITQGHAFKMDPEYEKQYQELAEGRYYTTGKIMLPVGKDAKGKAIFLDVSNKLPWGSLGDPGNPIGGNPAGLLANSFPLGLPLGATLKSGIPNPLGLFSEKQKFPLSEGFNRNPNLSGLEPLPQGMADNDKYRQQVGAIGQTYLPPLMPPPLANLEGMGLSPQGLRLERGFNNLASSPSKYSPKQSALFAVAQSVFGLALYEPYGANSPEADAILKSKLDENDPILEKAIEGAEADMEESQITAALKAGTLDSDTAARIRHSREAKKTKVSQYNLGRKLLAEAFNSPAARKLAETQFPYLKKLPYAELNRRRSAAVKYLKDTVYLDTSVPVAERSRKMRNQMSYLLSLELQMAELERAGQ